jgi:hypothetical protein
VAKSSERRNVVRLTPITAQLGKATFRSRLASLVFQNPFARILADGNDVIGSAVSRAPDNQHRSNPRGLSISKAYLYLIEKSPWMPDPDAGTWFPERPRYVFSFLLLQHHSLTDILQHTSCARPATWLQDALRLASHCKTERFFSLPTYNHLVPV